jgi:hypothetical protein
MIGALWLALGVIWASLWVILLAVLTAGLQHDRLIGRLGMLLPICMVTSTLAVIFGLPAQDPTAHRTVLILHHTSFVMLFLFLLGAEYLQLEAWIKIRRASVPATIALSFRRLWVLTELAPGSVAPVILLTGLRLIWDTPQPNSPGKIWLFVIIVAFGLFFFDGLLGYTPIVQRWHVFWSDCAGPYAPAHATRCVRTGDCLQLLLHCVSWPFLFLLGLWQYDVPSSGIANWVDWCNQRLNFLSASWSAVAVALLLFLAAGALVALLRVVGRR